MISHPSSWCRALTFQERLALSRANEGTSRLTESSEKAVQRLQQWRQHFGTTDQFVQRLANDGLCEDEVLALFDEPLEALHKHISQMPAWLQAFEQAYAAVDADDGAIALPDAFRGQAFSLFLEAIRPLLSQSRSQIQHKMTPLLTTAPHLFDSETIINIILTTLPWKALVSMLGRTMALELHVARLQEVLQGDTPEERFYSFIERLRQPDYREELFAEYPVLARQLTQTLAQWEHACIEFFQRLCMDWSAIRSTFNQQVDPGPIIDIRSDAGDSHRRGHVVMIVTFRNGMRLVYKPRSLATDIHFQELLEWINSLEECLPFRILRVLDRGSYGWVEYVEAQGCDSPDKVHRFYERQGQYLALLYALNATDMFYENIIAEGEHPILIDLETLLHPRINSQYASTLTTFAVQAIDETVLRVGMLPHRQWTDTDSDGIDISALGMRPGAMMSGVPAWEHAGTDMMYIGFGSVQMTVGNHRPLLQGNSVDVTEYTEAIVTGFRRMYQLLLDYRDDLLSTDGHLAHFDTDEIRAILRPTITYYALLRESFHPDMLRDALDRDCFFEHLWSAVEQRPFLAGVVAAECEDLLHGDIPIFTTQPNSCHIWTSAQVQISDFFDQPSLDAVFQHIRRLDQQNLDQQIWFIRATLAALAIGEGTGQSTSYQLNEAALPTTSTQLIAEARAIGDRIAALAIQNDHDVAWIGLTLEHNRYWTVAPLGVDLYAGQAGIVFFLGYLGAITQEQQYTVLARRGLETLQRKLANVKTLEGLRIGMDGWGGIIYTFMHLGTLWDDQTLITYAMRMANYLPELIEQDTYFNIISGVAGCLLCLIPVYHQAPTGALRAILTQCGNHILAGAQTMEYGIGWTSPGSSVPLAGFAHGAAGIAWSLTALASLFGEQRFASAAENALAYERTLFDPGIENWPYIDTTDQSSSWDTQQVVAWCHGAPGIGLARLQMLQEIDDTHIYQEIDTALNTTMTKGFGLNHSLCHGDLGNIELLIQVCDKLDKTALQPHIDRLASGILESIKHSGWCCGVPEAVESPGLMTGLAGIGYGLLRLAKSSHIPAVLTFASPIAAEYSPHNFR